jgi:hypothetical protein
MMNEQAQKAVALIQDPAWQKNAQAVVNSPNLKWLYAGLLIVTVLYILLKRRVLAATDRWWAQILLRLGLAVVYFLGLFVASYLVLGQPVIELTKSMWGSLR